MSTEREKMWTRLLDIIHVRPSDMEEFNNLAPEYQNTIATEIATLTQQKQEAERQLSLYRDFAKDVLDSTKIIWKDAGSRYEPYLSDIRNQAAILQEPIELPALTAPAPDNSDVFKHGTDAEFQAWMKSYFESKTPEQLWQDLVDIDPRLKDWKDNDLQPDNSLEALKGKLDGKYHVFFDDAGGKWILKHWPDIASSIYIGEYDNELAAWQDAAKHRIDEICKQWRETEDRHLMYVIEQEVESLGGTMLQEGGSPC